MLKTKKEDLGGLICVHGKSGGCGRVGSDRSKENTVPKILTGGIVIGHREVVDRPNGYLRTTLESYFINEVKELKTKQKTRQTKTTPLNLNVIGKTVTMLCWFPFRPT